MKLRLDETSTDVLRRVAGLPEGQPIPPATLELAARTKMAADRVDQGYPLSAQVCGLIVAFAAMLGAPAREEDWREDDRVTPPPTPAAPPEPGGLPPLADDDDEDDDDDEETGEVSSGEAPAAPADPTLAPPAPPVDPAFTPPPPPPAPEGEKFVAPERESAEEMLATPPTMPPGLTLPTNPFDGKPDGTPVIVTIGDEEKPGTLDGAYGQMRVKVKLDGSDKKYEVFQTSQVRLAEAG